VVSLYYYLAVVKTMYFREPEREFFAGGGRLSLSFALAVYAGAVLLLGILPDGLIAAAFQAAR
jgi:NADH:ubiquinone oxidoreductase subunit 2 (subunit N)